MNFKVGDLVKVKNGLKGGEKHGNLYFNVDMEKYCGKVFKIKSITPRNTYILEECKAYDGIDWKFNDAMVETPNLLLKDIDFTQEGFYKGVTCDTYLFVKDGKMKVIGHTEFTTVSKLIPIKVRTLKLQEIVDENGQIPSNKAMINSEVIHKDTDLSTEQHEYFNRFNTVKDIVTKIINIYAPIVAVNILLKSDFYCVME